MRRLALLLLAAFGFAQEKPEAPDLHKIYVPYTKLDEVLGTDKERVMVPYKEFLELWKLKYGPKTEPGKPPVPFVVESATYEGKVQEGVAAFQAALEIEVLAEGWQRVPLAFSKVAFEEVTVDGAPGVLAPSGQGYELLLRGVGRHKVEARFVAGIARGKEFATCAFDLPAVPLHKLSFRVPGKGTEIKLEPARAMTTTNEGEETVLLAFLGPQPSVQLTWRSQPEEMQKEPPLIFATDLVAMTVEERVLRGLATFDLQVLRTPASTFRVRIPAGVQVLEVSGANLKTWNFADEARTLLDVSLHEPATGAYQMGVVFETPFEVPGPLPLPVLRLEAAARERGFLRVKGAEGVGLRPAALENAFQIDVTALPDLLKVTERALGFRFPALPYAVTLTTERIAPRVSVTARARLEVERRRIKLNEVLNFNVERAGVFSLKVDVPEWLTLTQVGDETLVDTRTDVLANGRRTITLELRGRRLGAFALAVTGEAPLDLAQGKLEVPLVRPIGADLEEGTLGVYMDPGIKAAADAKGVVPLEPLQLAQEDPFPSPLPLSFAWRWHGPGAAVSFAVEAKKPKVTCDVLYALQADEGKVRIRADLFYTVQFTEVDTFRFRVPKSIVDRLKVEGSDIREKPHADDPVEEGKIPTTTFTISLQGPKLGKVAMWAEYDDVFKEPLRVNEHGAVAVPQILPLDVESANSFVAVRKSPALKVDAEGPWEEIDPSELPEALRSPDVFLALRRLDEPEPFRLELVRHEYQPVADVVVRLTYLKTVLADEKTATTTAFFEILNNDRQFLAVQLPEESQIQDLRVAGKPEKPRLGEGHVLLVPLETGLKKDATFQVAIAYTHPVKTKGALVRDTAIVGPKLPAFGDGAKPAQALLSWVVYYPKGWCATGFDGNVWAADEEGARGTWLRRAIFLLGDFVRPVSAAPEGNGAEVRRDRLQGHRAEPDAGRERPAALLERHGRRRARDRAHVARDARRVHAARGRPRPRGRRPPRATDEAVARGRRGRVPRAGDARLRRARLGGVLERRARGRRGRDRRRLDAREAEGEVMRRLSFLLLAAIAMAGGKDAPPPPAPPSLDDPKVWIHAPAEDLLPLKGAGFLITIEEYRKLVELARANEALARERPPLAGRLVRGACVARIDGDVLRITAKYTAVVQGEGHVEIPFRVEGIALEKIANLRGDVLAFEKPGTYEVEATLLGAARARGRPPARGVPAARPRRATRSRWTCRPRSRARSGRSCARSGRARTAGASSAIPTRRGSSSSG